MHKQTNWVNLLDRDNGIKAEKAEAQLAALKHTEGRVQISRECNK